MFEEMVKGIQEDTIRMIMAYKLNHEMKREQVAKPVAEISGEVGAIVTTKKQKVGRNSSSLEPVAAFIDRFGRYRSGGGRHTAANGGRFWCFGKRRCTD
jgi:preprotein translocase subunit SecA